MVWSKTMFNDRFIRYNSATKDDIAKFLGYFI